MALYRPQGLLAGFHADRPDPAVPEVLHLGEQWTPMAWAIGRHEHAVWELYLQLDGTSVWSSQRRTFRLDPGHWYAAPPGLEHRLVRALGNHHYVFAGLDVDAVLRRMPALAAPWRRRDFAHHAHAASIEAPFRQLVREAVTAQPFRTEGLRAALEAVVIEATRLLAAGPADSLLLAMHPGVRRAKQLMEEHPEQPWRLVELGRAAGLSPSHFAGLFAKEVGLPPRQHLLRLRIARAKHELATSDAAITAIAFGLGFSSSQHFAKTFRKQVRASAKQWRDRHQRGKR
jgi:AraC-like DNA-binding protein